jgi:hypothetical protein
VFCSPTITTAEECWRLFDEANRKLALRGSPHRYDVLIVDYADKLGWPKEFKGTYEGQNHVFEALLHGTRERNVWTWTASQAKRRDKKKSKNGLLRMEDVADSMHKVRNSDVVLTLNPTADYSLVRVLLDKHRTGVSGFLSELMPTNFAYGRLVQPELPNHRGGHIPDDSLTLPFQ